MYIQTSPVKGGELFEQSLVMKFIDGKEVLQRGIDVYSH
ncbi:hypothetical protein PLUTE_a3155 [Pseudoalteromonas luteoviolacea DSM 6061]|nr:hypothetical protein [Pseudoalteromonas luteoviolacea DSM 6061]